MPTPQIYWSHRHGQYIMTTSPQEDAHVTDPISKTCDACGHDETNAPWPNPDVCPRCWPEFQAEAPIPPRRRVPIASLPTKDRLLLQAILTLASELVLRFHPSEQVAWLNYFLEQLDVQHLAKFQRYTHINYVLQALRREISDRLETGRW